MKLIIISCIAFFSILFSGCEAYEIHKEMEKQKQVKERTFYFYENKIKKKINISTERIVSVEADKPFLFSVYSDQYIKSVSSEKVLDDFLIKIIFDENQFNFSTNGSKIKDREIVLLVNEEESNFILKALEIK